MSNAALLVDASWMENISDARAFSQRYSNCSANYDNNALIMVTSLFFLEKEFVFVGVVDAYIIRVWGFIVTTSLRCHHRRLQIMRIRPDISGR